MQTCINWGAKLKAGLVSQVSRCNQGWNIVLSRMYDILTSVHWVYLHYLISIGGMWSKVIMETIMLFLINCSVLILNKMGWNFGWNEIFSFEDASLFLDLLCNTIFFLAVKWYSGHWHLFLNLNLFIKVGKSMVFISGYQKKYLL